MGESVARPLIEVEYGHNGDRLLALLRKQHPDYHPILNIAKIAHTAESGVVGREGVVEPDLELALKAHTTVLRYVEPELKSVEVTMANQKRRAINVSLFEDDEPGRELAATTERQRVISRIIDGEFVGEDPAGVPEASGVE